MPTSTPRAQVTTAAQATSTIGAANLGAATTATRGIMTTATVKTTPGYATDAAAGSATGPTDRLSIAAEMLGPWLIVVFPYTIICVSRIGLRLAHMQYEKKISGRAFPVRFLFPTPTSSCRFPPL